MSLSADISSLSPSQVSSSSEDKIARAVALGAKGGINYKDGTVEPFPCPAPSRSTTH
jgi:hypothetical protein